MGIISYTHFKGEEMQKFLSIVALGLIGLVSQASAADPLWFTDTMSTMAEVLVMVGTAISAIVGVKVAPLVWHYIRPILFRG